MSANTAPHRMHTIDRARSAVPCHTRRRHDIGGHHTRSFGWKCPAQSAMVATV